MTELQPYQQRVVDEKADLDERTRKLATFIADNPLFGGLPCAERDRLRRQYHLMAALSRVLGERIAEFN